MAEWFWVKVRTLKVDAALSHGNLDLGGGLWMFSWLTFSPQVTTSGQFVFPLDSPHKKPYEVLVLGRYRSSAEDSIR